MLKNLLCGLALATCSLGAAAAEQTYDWSFTGFTPIFTDLHEDITIAGRLTVDDLNGDGRFDLAEVKHFTYDTTRNLDYIGCAGASDGVTCGLESFSFQPGGALDFSLKYHDPNGGYDISRRIDVGDTWGNWYSSGGQGEPYFSVYYWNDKTIGSVTAVPEPQTWLMFGIGALALTGAARRRSRRA